MRWGPLKFYAACIHRAFAGWFGIVSGWAGTLALLVAIASLLFDLPSPFKDLAEKAEPTFFLVVLSAILVFRLLLAPYWLYRDEYNSRKALEYARQPCLVLRLPDPPALNDVWLSGNTHESLAGTRQTILRQTEFDVVALTCTNSGETEAEGCRARLLSATRINADGNEDLGVVEAVALPWDKRDPEGSHEINILPAESRRIWIGGVRPQGNLWLFREIQGLPLEYQQLLGKPGIYRIVLQIDARNVPSQQVALEIVAAPGQVIPNARQRGLVDVKIIGQGAPSIVTADL